MASSIGIYVQMLPMYMVLIQAILGRLHEPQRKTLSTEYYVYNGIHSASDPSNDLCDDYCL